MLAGMLDTIKYSADQSVESAMTSNVEYLSEGFHPIVHQLLQSIGWAFNWDMEANELRQIYDFLQRQ